MFQYKCVPTSTSANEKTDSVEGPTVHGRYCLRLPLHEDVQAERQVAARVDDIFCHREKRLAQREDIDLHLAIERPREQRDLANRIL